MTDRLLTATVRRGEHVEAHLVDVDEHNGAITFRLDDETIELDTQELRNAVAATAARAP